MLTILSFAGRTHAQNEKPAGPLPAHALWQIGEFGENLDANGFYRLEYSDDGLRLAGRDRKNQVNVFDTTTHEKLFSVAGHDNNWIETIDFSPDGKFFTTAAGSSENVKIWHADDGKLAAEIETDAKAAYFSDDGLSIHVLGKEQVDTYRWPAAEPLSEQRWQSQNEQPVAMSRDGSLVMSYERVNRLVFETNVFDLNTNRKLKLQGENTIPKYAVFSRDNFWVAATYQRSGKIQLWDLRDPQNSRYVLDGHDEPVQSLAFSPDNRWLASSGWDEKVIVWDLLTRQRIGEFTGHAEHVNTVSFSPLDFTFASGASGSSDTSILIWDLRPLMFPESLNRELKFEIVWQSMGVSNVQPALSATHYLVKHAADFLPDLNLIVTAEASASADENIRELVQQLNATQFSMRENATQRLIEIRAIAEPALRPLLDQTLAVETRYRLSKILNHPHERPRINIADDRRWHRLVLALEMTNTFEANDLLTRIATGHGDVDVAAAAQGAIDRNQQRSK